MPWLQAWTGCLERGQVPRAARRGKLLTPEGLPGSELSQPDTIVEGLSARRYRGGRELAAMVSFWPSPNQVLTTLLYYGNGRKFSRRCMFRRRANDRAGEWVQLLESKGSPRAVLGRFFPGMNGRSVREVATLATLRTRAGKIKFVPLPWRLRGAESTDPLWVEWDTRAKRSVIVNSLTGRRVADGPLRPNARTALGLNSVRRVGGGFRIGGVEVTGEERDRRFRLAWYRQHAKGFRWRRHSLPLATGYCRPFLPPALRGLALDPDRVEDVALWKDGSLIFRFAASSPVAPEQLHFCGIARQPQHGKAQLLAWAVYHSYNPPPALRDQGVRGIGERRWNEDESGRIRSQSGLECGWVHDFHFDTDFANGDVIFRQGNELWAVRLGPGVTPRGAVP